MKNYYQECLDSINTFISENKINKALAMLNTELSMPYVPEPYLSEFEKIKLNLSGHSGENNAYFLDMENIHRALLGDDMLQAKALISLERMNLRSVEDELILILEDHLIDENLKRYVLMICMEQEINLKVKLEHQGVLKEFNLQELENPFYSELYNSIKEDLTDMFESNNPSLLQLCYEELNLQLIATFPFMDKTITADKIAKQVAVYMNRG